METSGPFFVARVAGAGTLALMTRTIIATSLLAAGLSLATPLQAQSQQDRLDARYDRALAAGYKALMLCSAIANAERNGATRTPESVLDWELTGIQPPLDKIVGELPYELDSASNWLIRVKVKWSDDGVPRVAEINPMTGGCVLVPIGTQSLGIEQLFMAEKPERKLAFRWGGKRASRYFYEKFEDLLPLDLSEQYGEGTRTTALLIKRKDQVFETYADGFDALTPQRTWSVAKSLSATIIGAAQMRGEANVEYRTRLPSWSDQGRRGITIDNLLRMTSGRYSDTPGNRTDPLYFGGSTVEETAAQWPLVNKPGTVFRYANNDTLMAVKAIEDTFGDHPPAAFFAKLGMDHTVAETDWQGDYILSSQVWSTARDLAKLGQLYLDDGVLPSGERILPEGWVEYVSSPSGPQPDGPLGYGAGFWLFNNSEGVPSDTFAAMGNRGQYVVIVPSRDIVIVRRGEDPTGSRFDIVAFTRDVLAALEE